MKKGVVSAVSMIVGGMAGALATGKFAVNKVEEIQTLSDKHLVLFKMMNQWVRVKQDGKNLAEYFEKNGYAKIAIYGMSYTGETLVDELRDSNVTVAYGIDKNADLICSDVNIVTMDDILEPVDAVVVTAVTFFDEIEEQLSEKVECPIISLEDLLYEL